MGTMERKWFREQDRLLLLEGWARQGLSDEEIAEKLDLLPETFRRYKHASPDIRQALARGRETADLQVEQALLRAALGYTCTEEKLEIRGEEEKLVRVTKEIPGDVSAALFWLKNRHPDRWRDKPEPPGDSGMLPDLIRELEDR